MSHATPSNYLERQRCLREHSRGLRAREQIRTPDLGSVFLSPRDDDFPPEGEIQK